MTTIIWTICGIIFGMIVGYYIREHENRVKSRKWAKSRLKLMKLDK